MSFSPRKNPVRGYLMLATGKAGGSKEPYLALFLQMRLEQRLMPSKRRQLQP